MKKGNLENLLGGAFTAGLEMNWEVERLPEIEKPFLTEASPEKIFDTSYDEAALAEVSNHAPKYKELTGRFNPFEYEKLRSSAGTWSILIDKPIITFQDACDHASALCRLWVREDAELEQLAKLRKKKLLEKEARVLTNIMVEGTKEYAIEQARLEWRQAVRTRNEICSQWNDYVNEKRKYYQNLRDN